MFSHTTDNFLPEKKKKHENLKKNPFFFLEGIQLWTETIAFTSCSNLIITENIIKKEPVLLGEEAAHTT